MRAADVLFETLRLRPRLDDAALREAWSLADVRGLDRLANYEHAHAWILRRLRESGAAQFAPQALVDTLARRVRDTEVRNLRGARSP